MARTLWPGQSAVGKRFRVSLPGQQPTWGQIVGVVANIRHRGLDSEDDRQIYFSYQQFTDGRIALVVRSRGRCAGDDAGGPAGDPVPRSRAAGL